MWTARTESPLPPPRVISERGSKNKDLATLQMYSQNWNCAASLFPKQNYNVLSPNSYTHISVRDLYTSRIGLTILLQPNIWTDPGNIKIAKRHMTVGIGTEEARFLFWEYINLIFNTVYSRNRNSYSIPTARTPLHPSPFPSHHEQKYLPAPIPFLPALATLPNSCTLENHWTKSHAQG